MLTPQSLGTAAGSAAAAGAARKDNIKTRHAEYISTEKCSNGRRTNEKDDAEDEAKGQAKHWAKAEANNKENNWRKRIAWRSRKTGMGAGRQCRRGAAADS